MVIVLILDVGHPVFAVLETVLVYTALILTVISLIDYVVKNRDVLREQK